MVVVFIWLSFVNLYTFFGLFSSRRELDYRRYHFIMYYYHFYRIAVVSLVFIPPARSVFTCTILYIIAIMNKKLLLHYIVDVVVRFLPSHHRYAFLSCTFLRLHHFRHFWHKQPLESKISHCLATIIFV